MAVTAQLDVDLKGNLKMPSMHQLLRSPALMVSVVVILCTIVVTSKIDTFSRELAGHIHASHDSPQEVQDGDDPSSVLHRHGGPHDNPSHAPAGSLFVVPEWAPVDAVAVALPGVRSQDVGYVKLLGDIVEACLRLANLQVLVIVEENDVGGRVACEHFIEENQLDATRVQFLEVGSLDSIWLRDYGPIFVRRRDDEQVFVVDAGYRDIRLGVEGGGVSALFGVTPTLRPADDLVPMYFSTYLDMPFVHPGFFMNAGDIYADGVGTIYTSEETLHLNSGDREYLSAIFGEYLGAEKVVYLRPLPGPTVKHLDMFFKLAGPNVCLLGEYQELSSSTAVACLQRAARRALSENAARLERRGLQVIRVPMPDISRLSKWDYYGHVFPTDRDRRLKELAEGARISANVMKKRLESESVYVYRTYLNSLLLVAPVEPAGMQEEIGRRLLIVPSYAELTTEVARKQVETAYRRGYGEDVEFVFVNAENLAHANGSLRCIMTTVPTRKSAK